ncbi:hypothetical protein BKA57DRAFT_137836 [Linnemannia elongata]|nr:hypothetical protein BKA57DRAFT_137836 [Linnemannia elongata]
MASTMPPTPSSPPPTSSKPLTPSTPVTYPLILPQPLYILLHTHGELYTPTQADTHSNELIHALKHTFIHLLSLSRPTSHSLPLALSPPPLRHTCLSPIDRGDTLAGEVSPSPIAFGTPQITFSDYSQNDILLRDPTPHHATFASNNKNGDSELNSNSNSRNNNHAVPSRPGKALLNQIRILQSATNLELDFEGQTEATAIYTLLVISSLSIVDNLIGIMVATRRSLRLTQVAFAIWCLRFLFRTLSLISVGFMLAVSAEFRRNHLPGVIAPSPQQQQAHQPNSTNIDGSGGGGLDFGEREQPTMYTITALEIIVVIVHGWSLLVLIRDLRNQPRPKTVLVRVWAWFCGTKFGDRLGLSRYQNYNPYLNVVEGGVGGGSGGGGGYRGVEGYVSLGAGGEAGVWDREIAASLGLNSGLLSSGSSIRSVAVSVPEMGVVPGRSRASSISSFCSAEKL